LTEPPDEIFGKIMSISDELMMRWYPVLEADLAGDVASRLRAQTFHPRDAKALLAERQVARFYDEPCAMETRRRFYERFSRRSLTDDLVAEEIVKGPIPSEISLPPFLTEAGLAKSNSDARRLLRQGAVRINGAQVLSERYSYVCENADSADAGAVMLVEVGKRRVRKFKFLGS
jgi:tyrosyl-tRNA synthetase